MVIELDVLGECHVNKSSAAQVAYKVPIHSTLIEVDGLSYGEVGAPCFHEIGHEAWPDAALIQPDKISDAEVRAERRRHLLDEGATHSPIVELAHLLDGEASEEVVCALVPLP